MKRAFVLAVLGAMAVPQPSRSTEIADVEREPLGELRLIAQPSSAPMVTIRIVFDAGSAEDPAGQEGVTALAAALMVEGGAGEYSYGEMTERLFPMAGELSVETSRDQTAFIGRVHRDHLDAFYEIFQSVLLEPWLESAAFERLRTRAVSAIELELRGNDDEQLGKEVLQAMIYEGHPYGHPTAGTVGALAGLRLEDVLAQRRRVFCAARAIVGVAGGYPEGFEEELRDDVASLDQAECVGRRRLAEPDLAGPRVWVIDKPESSAVAISLGMPIDVVRGDPDYPALVLAAAYLGQHRTFAGRLMNEMRVERGLNYGDYAYVEHFDQAGWSAMPRPNSARRQQYFSIWVRPVNVEQAHFALRMAVKEMRTFAEEGLSEADFERIRAFVQGYYALYLQTESRRLGFAIDDAFYGSEQAWIDALQTSWSALTRDEVNAAIRRHVDPANVQIAVVHPEAAAFADLVASEAPSPITYAADVPQDVIEEDAAIVSYVVGIPRDRMAIVPLSDVFRGQDLAMTCAVGPDDPCVAPHAFTAAGARQVVAIASEVVGEDSCATEDGETSAVPRWQTRAIVSDEAGNVAASVPLEVWSECNQRWSWEPIGLLPLTGTGRFGLVLRAHDGWDHPDDFPATRVMVVDLAAATHPLWMLRDLRISVDGIDRTTLVLETEGYIEGDEGTHFQSDLVGLRYEDGRVTDHSYDFEWAD